MSTLAAPPYWQTACGELAAADPVMAALIAHYPDAILANRGDPFQTLARAIVGQQISVKAADSIWARFAGYAQTIRPEHIATLQLNALAACGLSRRKAEYLRDLAGHFVDGRIEPTRWKKMDDETVIAELTDVRGIGRWTAEMFLIFSLRRPDIWPVTISDCKRQSRCTTSTASVPARQSCEGSANATRPGVPSPPGICGEAWTQWWCSTDCRFRPEAVI